MQAAEPTTKKHGWRRGVKRLLYTILTVYLVLVLMLAFLQRSLIYFPSKESDLAPSKSRLAPGQVHAIELTSHDDLLLHGWRIRPHGDLSTSADEHLADEDRVVLYFSGNAGNRSYRHDETGLLADLGCHVFLFDYRGYGDNPGSPTESDLHKDAMSAWQYVTETRKIDPSRVLLYGESLGGGVAVRLAAELSRNGAPPAGLILRSTFSSLVDAAAVHYPWLPVRLVMIDRFESAKHIPDVTCPILQIHGARDTIVPLRLAKRLFAAAPSESETGISKHFAELPEADHNDVVNVETARYCEAITTFLNRI